MYIVKKIENETPLYYAGAKRGVVEWVRDSEDAMTFTSRPLAFVVAAAHGGIVITRGAKWGAGTPHRHTEFLLSDNEFRCVPIRGKVLAQVPPDLIHFRLEKFTDDGAQWMLSLTVNHPDGPCRCRWWDAPPKERE